MIDLCFAGRKLFGDGYSGLEYDYRGLLTLYQQTDQGTKFLEYGRILQNWTQIRDRTRLEQKRPLELEDCKDMEEIIKQFFEMQGR